MTASVARQQDRLIVSGKLDFTTVIALWKRCLPLLDECKELHLDLSGVVSSSSAGIAWMLECIKYAKKTHKHITFSHVPSRILSIAAAAGLDGFVHFKNR